MQATDDNNEEYIHDHANDKFFGIVGSILTVFGVCIVIFNMMYSPVLSGLAALCFFLVGGTCLMLSVGGFLKYLDETFF